MKKYYLFLEVCFLLFVYSAAAQDTTLSTPHFDIGTKWTYEEARSSPPIIQRPKAHEITGQTTWQDTLVYVIEPGVYSAMDYMYVHGDSIYFWDWRSEVFQLNYDFSDPQPYEAVWSSYSFDVGPNTAQITVDSVRQEMIFDHTFEVQYLTAQGDQLAPISARVFSGIGNDYGLKFGLGEDVDNFQWYIDKLRCFEDGGNVYRFVDYPCDSTLFVSTDEVLNQENDMRIYPNPSAGTVTIEHDRQHEDFPYRVYDLSGKLVQSGTTQGSQLEIQRPGKYILVIDDDGVHRAYRVAVVR
ncbi:MAG: T9SS type A sorting domain-containing protein [Bacteroidetes bacterium]|jgi:hypothetical protein|nr:T9SS type A sorting domain-containing protein [Bacteroidota bacterium]